MQAPNYTPEATDHPTESLAAQVGRPVNNKQPQGGALQTQDNAGQALYNPERGKPFWQVQPCIPDCLMHHTDDDHPEDRCCISTWAAQVVLSLHEVHERLYAGESEPLQWIPELTVSLHRDYREIEPRVFVGPEVLRDDLPGLELTVDEAEQLGSALLEATTRARVPAKIEFDRAADEAITLTEVDRG